MEQYKVFEGLDNKGTFGNGIDADENVCTNLPAFALMLLMAASGWISILVVVHTVKLRMRLRSLMQPPFTTTWSYTISINQWNGEKQLDVFHILNLNIKFKEVMEVTWTNITCAKDEPN